MSKYFEDINVELASFFVLWQVEDVENRINVLPEESRLVFQIDGHTAFNDWSRKLVDHNSQLVDEEYREIVYVTFFFLDHVQIDDLMKEQIVKENIQSIRISHILADAPVTVPS